MKPVNGDTSTSTSTIALESIADNRISEILQSGKDQIKQAVRNGGDIEDIIDATTQDMVTSIVETYGKPSNTSDEERLKTFAVGARACLMRYAINELNKRIITRYVHPPIPTREFDWVAYFDGEEEGYNGKGATEQEAVKDLLENRVS